ncbi:MAG: acyclic terpene utilization AtuA family protein [Parvularculaceae bacterium]
MSSTLSFSIWQDGILGFMTRKSIRIGGASGYWGESAMATPQLLRAGGLDFIILDYLAEITMSILARAKAKDPNTGYATDFVTAVMQPHLPEIAMQGVKIITNAGGLNPESCAEAVRRLIKDQGLDLKVATVSGDDASAQAQTIARSAPKEMFTGADFPAPDQITSINHYLGAFPIAHALSAGADIVITGRCVDSALTLGACIHEFDWAPTDWDYLANGSLAGHILECGPQATGGNFTDWEDAGDIANIGYPVAEVSADGSFILSKPDKTTGLVNIGTVCEQMLYEIGDPQAYILPDVVCDFSEVKVTQGGPDKVHVSNAKGRPAPASYKTCLTYRDGFRGGMMLSFYGIDAEKKAANFAKAAFARSRAIMRRFNAGDFTETSVEIIGAESQFGAYRKNENVREVALKIAARHAEAMAIGLLLREIVGLGLASPPGISGFAGGRPKPSPVVRQFSYLTPKSQVEICVDCDGQSQTMTDPPGAEFDAAILVRPAAPAPVSDASVAVPLIKLAWARSGDKGDKANVGVIARKPHYLPYIWAGLSTEVVKDRFAHFLAPPSSGDIVQRFLLPGASAVNFLIDNVLGGGGAASIRNDPQGKGYAQILLACPVLVSPEIAREIA